MGLPIPLISVRAECVRCPKALQWKEVSTIFVIIFLSFFFSPPHTFLPEGVEILHGVLSHKKNKIWGKKYLGGISRLLLAIVEIEFTTLKNSDLLVFIFKYNLSIPLIWFVKLTWLYTMPDYYSALWHPNQPTSSNQLQNLENCLKNLLCGKVAK